MYQEIAVIDRDRTKNSFQCHAIAHDGIPIVCLQFRRAVERTFFAKLRTMERRIRSWRALQGPNLDVIFRGVQAPGRTELSDFMDMADPGAGTAVVGLDNWLYHFRLACSGFEHSHVIFGNESYVALPEGLQNTLLALDGARREHCSDSLSAAFGNLDASTREDLTHRYDALYRCYRMEPSRNNRGFARKNARSAKRIPAERAML